MKSIVHNKEHGKIWFIQREKEIATLTVETMEKDIKNGVVSTEDFWLVMKNSGVGKYNSACPNAIEVYTKGK